MPELMPIFMDTLSEGHCTDQKWEECHETLHHSVFLILNLNCICWSQRLIRLYWSKIRQYSDNDRNVDARWSTCPWRCLHWIGGTDQRYHQGTHCRTHCKTHHFYDFFRYLYDSICNILCVWLDLLSLRENCFGRCLYLNTTIDWWNATEFGNFFVLALARTCWQPTWTNWFQRFSKQSLMMMILSGIKQVQHLGQRWLYIISYTNLQTLKLKIS